MDHYIRLEYATPSSLVECFGKLGVWNLLDFVGVVLLGINDNLGIIFVSSRRLGERVIFQDLLGLH